MNKFLGIGRITKDIELRHTSSNIPVAQFTLAINRKFKDENGENQADFINCVAWRKLAENISEYCGKGSHVAVLGTIQVRQYDDSKGESRWATEIVCDEVEFLTPRESEPKRQPQKAQTPDEIYQASKDLAAEDDLPF